MGQFEYIVRDGDGLVSRFGNIDWTVLYKKLRIFADRLCGGANATFDCGLSGEDVVCEVLEKFFESSNGLGWMKKKGTLDNFLFKVVQNKVIDHLRRNKEDGWFTGRCGHFAEGNAQTRGD